MCIYIRDRNTLVFFSVIFSLNFGDHWVLFAYLFTHVTSHHVGKLHFLACDNYLIICHLSFCVIPDFLHPVIRSYISPVVFQVCKCFERTLITVCFLCSFARLQIKLKSGLNFPAWFALQLKYLGSFYVHVFSLFPYFYFQGIIYTHKVDVQKMQSSVSIVDM